MKNRFLLILGVASLVALTAFLFLPTSRNTIRGVYEEPQKPDATQPAFTEKMAHPLDPLSKEELAAAVNVLKEEGKLSPGALFPILTLHEPPKEDVLRFQPGRPLHREAFAVVLDRGANKTHEAVIDLKERKTSVWRQVPGVQPAVLIEEFRTAGEVVRKDSAWRTAMSKRGFHEKDLDKIYFDVWAVGDPAPTVGKGARLLRVISFYRGDSDNPYARPIEGVVATVNMNTQQVIHLLDRGAVPMTKDSGDYFDPEYVGSLRQAPMPLIVSQPKGPSFVVRGHEVRWQKWRFRYALHPREGLVLYTLGYEDGDAVRPILYRASLAEMIVPYGDPADSWAWRNAFDEGEYGLGRLASSLQKGHEVPDNAVLLDATFADDQGKAYVHPRAIALYEQDGGILWTHTDFKKTAVCRARQLVLHYLVAIGNYDYGIRWIFNQDGSLELQAELNGVVLAKAVQARKCEVCTQHADAEGKIIPRGEDRNGTLVAPNIVGTNHQHFFCFRLDFDVDGPTNSVAELNTVAAPPGPDNPNNNAFLVEESLLQREGEAQRDLHPESNRTWKVFNPRRTALGHYPGYLLEPGANTVPFVRPDTALRRRANFLDHHVWVTRQKPTEMYAAGDYPNQAGGGDGLARWVRDNEGIENQDVVLWYTVGLTHVPRVEDWPIMPAAHVGFRLLPEGFFNRNPALDVPAFFRR
jgi:primary-amine oxidase